MYNLAKISSKRAAPMEPNIQYRVAVVNTAMHYINLQLISVFIYYTLKIRKQNIQHRSKLIEINFNFFHFLFLSFEDF